MASNPIIVAINPRVGPPGIGIAQANALASSSSNVAPLAQAVLAATRSVPPSFPTPPGNEHQVGRSISPEDREKLKKIEEECRHLASKRILTVSDVETALACHVRIAKIKSTLPREIIDNEWILQYGSLEQRVDALRRGINTQIMKQLDAQERLFNTLDKNNPASKIVFSLATSARAYLVLFKRFPKQLPNVDKNRWEKFYKEIVQVETKLRKEEIAGPSRYSPNTCSPLTQAVFNCDSAKVRQLLEKGEDIDAVDGNGFTPLQMAVEYGMVDMIRLLIHAGANINAANERGFTALYLAVDNGDHAITIALINLGADVNVIDNEGNTALHIVADNGHLGITMSLIDAGANVNATNKYGSTALHNAAYNGCRLVTMILIGAKANIDAVDLEGRSPLVLAIMEGRKEIADILEKKGADVGLAQTIISRITLAHAWGIGGTSVIALPGNRSFTIALEGGNSYHFQKVISECFADFCSQADNGLTQKAMATVQDALVNAYPHNRNLTGGEMARRINQGQPMLIGGGFEGHVIGIVITNQGVMICNRGEARDPAYAIKYYERDPTVPMTASMVEKFIKIYSDHANYEMGIEGAIQEMHLTHNPRKGIQQSDQKVGICSFVATTNGLLALFYALDLEGQLRTNSQDTYRTIYKRFKTHEQLLLLDNYPDTCPVQYRDRPLLKEVQKKVQRKPYLSRALRRKLQTKPPTVACPRVEQPVNPFSGCSLEVVGCPRVEQPGDAFSGCSLEVVGHSSVELSGNPFSESDSEEDSHEESGNPFS